MTLFSIIMPTLRPQLAQMAIDSIRASSPGIEFEIVVVSPFAFRGDNILYVEEADRRGSCHAQAMGYAASRGDVIVTFSDDHLATLGWLDTVEDLLAAKERQHFPFALGISRAESSWFGTAFGLYYPYFPILSRASVEKIGGWISSDYRAHFGDADLAMRVWQGGGRCELSFHSYLLVNPYQAEFVDSPLKSSAFDQDAATFLDKYHAAHGNGFIRHIADAVEDYFYNYMQDGTFMLRIPPRLVKDNAWEMSLAGELSRKLMFREPLSREPKTKPKVGS